MLRELEAEIQETRTGAAENQKGIKRKETKVSPTKNRPSGGSRKYYVNTEEINRWILVGRMKISNDTENLPVIS